MEPAETCVVNRSKTPKSFATFAIRLDVFLELPKLSEREMTQPGGTWREIGEGKKSKTIRVLPMKQDKH